jgi:predicted ATPase
MFKLIYLKVSRHPQLGTVEIPLVEENEIGNYSQPYTSVIIGANGTGKSYILRTVAEIFRQFKNYHDNPENDLNLPFNIHLRYQYYDNTYEIVSKRLVPFGKIGGNRSYLFFKNRPFDKLFTYVGIPIEKPTKYDVPHNEVKYPDKLIVSSIMLNDRFTFADSKPDDFYQYLGIRRTRSMTSTQTFSSKTIRYLFDAKRSDTFIDDFSDMLDFMGFEKFLKVHYNTKYNSLFFSGNLNLQEFRGFYKEWWKSGHTNRKETNPLWGLWYYEKLEKESPNRFQQIIDYLNSVANSREKVFDKPRSKSKRLELDLFNYEYSTKEYDFIEELIKLDILNLEGIKIKKKENEFSLEQSSSGEYHLLLSLLGLYSKIEKASLILIDEPEISLHPNWQMRYINFLKNMFSRFPGCHFILTTHSHFLVSDLEGKSSSVLSITRDTETNVLTSELLVGQDTYGWSAEEILYRVFKVRTTRNFYLETELRELLHKIAIKSNETVRMKEILENLKELSLSEEDPMNLIISKAEKYLNK